MSTTTISMGRKGYFADRSALDWVAAAASLLATAFALTRYSNAMDAYEKGILLALTPAVIWLVWLWRPLRTLSAGVALASACAIWLYNGATDNFGADLARAEQVFLLRYFLSSQSAILWMAVLVMISTLFYWIGFFTSKQGENAALKIGSGLAWASVFMALVGTAVRWYESHQIGPDIGHIPVSNLYEVFVLFCWVTTTFYLYYEERYKTRMLGGFSMLIVTAAVGFLLWFTVARGAHEIQPLVPALQSWWMKIHVPANFVGYGTFAIAAMVAFAYLVKQQAQETRWYKALPLWLMGVALCLEPLVFRKTTMNGYWAVYFGVSAILAGAIIAARRIVADRLPSFEVLDDLMYKAIAVGFAFFTVATILGAFWAAEAWGGYWSWDPKETWALIVWLNYAAWLHMRLVKGLRGGMAAWWALVGLAVTSFAFLGVNMFLSGLHSYGAL